jgi:hypothetical protein
MQFLVGFDLHGSSLPRLCQVADRCTPNAHAQLYTEILDKYLYFFEAGNELIPPANIMALKDLVGKHMDSTEEGCKYLNT